MTLEGEPKTDKILVIKYYMVEEYSNFSAY